MGVFQRNGFEKKHSKISKCSLTKCSNHTRTRVSGTLTFRVHKACVTQNRWRAPCHKVRQVTCPKKRFECVNKASSEDISRTWYGAAEQRVSLSQLTSLLAPAARSAPPAAATTRTTALPTGHRDTVGKGMSTEKSSTHRHTVEQTHPHRNTDAPTHRERGRNNL